MHEQMLLAARSAAHLCQRVQQAFITVNQKVGAEPVTIADYGSQALICRAIAQLFPDDGVLAEESGDQFLKLVDADQRQQIVNLIGEILGETVTQDDVVGWLNHGIEREAERHWIIDPIDGTKGFIGLRRYTIAIGLLTEGEPRESLMVCPGYPHENGMGLIFYTREGAAYRQPLSGGTPERVTVSDRTGDDPIRIAESYEAKHVLHDEMAEIYAAAGFRAPILERVDGQDKYAMVACGDADLYLRMVPKRGYIHKVWDHAAGYALVRAAGGQATDLDGSPLIFSQGHAMPNQGMLVTSGRIHDRMIAALSSLPR